MNQELTLQPSKEALALINVKQAWHYRLIPDQLAGGKLKCWLDEQENEQQVANELEMILGLSVELEIIASAAIQKALTQFYRRDTVAEKDKAVLFSSSMEDFLPNLIREAKNLNSSDIHIESYEERCRVRIRIDGMMVERYLLDKGEYPGLINKIKILANLDIAEKRLPQDGRIFFNKGGQKFDIRVSVLPTLHGEKVVLRLLSNDATNIDIQTLGFSDLDIANYLEGVRRPNGMVLISGPTGSGKTTTLYATLKLLNKETRNILTIEDPIEYTLEGINQVQLKESIGLNFASALKTFLRQDPDVIMVGEIRDSDTASMAIRASLTGHLVLSTIHTNSAWGTVSRLVDMGVPPYLISNTLNTSVAQRLVRLLCKHCKAEEALDANVYPRRFKPFKVLSTHWVPKGCEHCHYTGYKGRKAVYEVIPIDFDLSELIKNNVLDISSSLQAMGIKTLAYNAFELLEHGETSIEEIYSLLMDA